MEKRIIRLTLEKKWFDLIVTGKKIREYREINDYWIQRFVGKEYDETIYAC